MDPVMKETPHIITVEPRPLAVAAARERPYLAAIARNKARFPVLGKLLENAREPSDFPPRVSVLEFSDSAVHEEVITNPAHLQARWATIRDVDSGSGIRGHLYVVEDLSATYMDALGSHFGIHPAFFIKHAHLPVFLKGEPFNASRRLPLEPSSWAAKGSRVGFSLRYYDLFKSGPVTAAANIPRRVVTTTPFPNGGPVLSILRNISLCVLSSGPGPWIALMLVDRPASGELLIPHASAADSFWSSDIFSPAPTPAPNQQGRKASNCLFDFVTNYWGKSATLSEIEGLNQSPGDSLSVFLARAVTSSWLGVVELVSEILSTNEYFTNGFEKVGVNSSANDVEQELSNLRKGLAACNRTRRQTLWYIDHMRVNLQTLMSRGISGGSEEFSAIIEKLNFAKERAESPIPVAIGACTILEAQRGSAEARSVNALTYLASLFVPFTVVSGIFSMSDGYLPGERSFWIFWATALPMVMAVVVAVYGLVWIGRRDKERKAS